MCTYNGERFLKEQLNSLLCQSFDDFIIYVHDDGSKDKTLEIINSYINQYPQKIVVTWQLLLMKQQLSDKAICPSLSLSMPNDPAQGGELPNSWERAHPTPP